ncbi:hypothetical protein MLD52_05340 [Puniceicoccaceae bacterium K14]|nr:hypothetical protein [Puniceicoccaceae bacterium K14]
MHRKILSVLAVFLIASLANAQTTEFVGNPDFSDWSGITKIKKQTATVKSGDRVSFTYSNQNRIYFPNIGRNYYGDSADWTNYSGLAFELTTKADTSTDITAVLKVDPKDYPESNPISTAKVRVSGSGKHSIYIPWEMFDIDAGQKWGTLFAIKHVELSFQSDTAPSFQLSNVKVTQGRNIALNAETLGKSSDAGSTVSYEFKVGNTTSLDQSVQLRVETEGWESMAATIEPQRLDLAPSEIQVCTLTIDIPAKLPTGIREKQIIKAIANGQGASVETLEFTTAVRVPTPNIVFTEDRWQEVKQKIDKYEWAQKGLERYESTATKWQVPEAKTKSLKEGVPLLGKPVIKVHERDFLNTGIAYQLTGKNEYAQKCLKVLLEVSNPAYGYPATFVGCSNSFVGEGKFWQAAGRAYDLIRDCEIITEQNAQQIEDTFRLFTERTIQGNTRGAISNWNIAEIHAALYCALNLQDWHLIDQLLSSPTGVYAHLEHGIMSDGWWYECSVGYNTWVATQFSEVSIALQPWGINFKDMTFPLGTTEHFSLLASRRVSGKYGMSFEKWGNIERNNIGIKDMWDASIPFLDFRGVLPAINDALEGKVSGKPYELAYYLYRDLEYAAIINRGDTRDLLYGVPDLPNITSEKMKISAYADNMGMVQLRSQTEGREQREQIQATMHYGSHGGYHGHFDRTNLVSMMRYGRSFYGTLMYWYSYGSYLYKFLKQTSINKNMVVVDEKMQLPVENERSLFHTGSMMQATVVETNSPWAYPPYGGIHYKPEQTFAEKMWEEGRTIKSPKNPPEYGEVTGHTEPIMQRRLMVVMDDYVVLADFLKAKEERQFDWMFQAKGFKDITAKSKSYLRHSSQMNTDPLGSAQFVTDCDWYSTKGTSRTQFEMCWGEGCDNEGVRLPHSLEGPLKIDVFNAWPQENEIMIGTSPEGFYVNKKLSYSVIADGETQIDEKTGAWILGSQNISVDVSGKKTLELTTKIEGNSNNNTIFWGDARLILKDKSEVFISSLPIEYENVLVPENEGMDYYNGPIKIQGELLPNSTPGMPKNLELAAKIKVDISNLDAVAFEAKIGSDFPMGDENSRLKTMAVRSHGSAARYLAVVEPYEEQSMIESVTAENADELIVKLRDGRVQKISISNLDSDTESVQVVATEYLEGTLIREEKTF